MENTYNSEQMESYNAIPVYYCKNCLSLRIMIVSEDDDDMNYCDECGNTDIGTCTIDEWNIMYEEKYKHKFSEYGRE